MIAIYTNPFSTQREQEGIISPSNNIFSTTRLRQANEEKKDAQGIISDKGHQIEIGNTTPLVDDLEIQDVCKVKDGKERGSVTDLVEEVSQLLRLVGKLRLQID